MNAKFVFANFFFFGFWKVTFIKHFLVFSIYQLLFDI